MTAAIPILKVTRRNDLMLHRLITLSDQGPSFVHSWLSLCILGFSLGLGLGLGLGLYY